MVSPPPERHQEPPTPRTSDPRQEVCGALPAAASLPFKDLAASGHETLDASGILAAIAARAEAGDPLAEAMAEVAGSTAPGDADDRPFGPASPRVLYERAVGLDQAGRAGEAAQMLAVLAEGSDSLAGLLGLAVLALRHDRAEAARALARAAAERGRHPRAFSVLGICALLAGDQAAAQAELAAAARAARGDPALRGELQLAQRALLLLHLRT